LAKTSSWSMCCHTPYTQRADRSRPSVKAQQLHATPARKKNKKASDISSFRWFDVRDDLQAERASRPARNRKCAGRSRTPLFVRRGRRFIPLAVARAQFTCPLASTESGILHQEDEDRINAIGTRRG
jgi:hypothetical protein